jgi:hypothetical protein
MACDSNDLKRTNVVDIILECGVVVVHDIAASQMEDGEFVEVDHLSERNRPTMNERRKELGFATCVLANIYQPRTK